MLFTEKNRQVREVVATGETLRDRWGDAQINWFGDLDQGIDEVLEIFVTARSAHEGVVR